MKSELSYEGIGNVRISRSLGQRRACGRRYDVVGTEYSGAVENEPARGGYYEVKRPLHGASARTMRYWRAGEESGADVRW